MRILLTGATGFIGSAFLKLALRRHHRVGALVRPESGGRTRIPDHEGLCCFAGSLAEAPWGQIEGFRPEVCVHAAWVTEPKAYLESSENQRYLDWSSDFLGQACQRGVRRVIALGTCSEYQIGREILSEDKTPVAPVSTYARCKNELRQALETSAIQHHFSLCWARVFYPYGVGEHAERLCSSIITRLARGERVALQTPASTKDYIYIEDLAAALLTVVEKEFAGTINLGTGVGVTVQQIAETIAKMLDRQGLLELPVETAVDPLGFVVGDATKLRSLGWQQRVKLQAGLARMIKYLTG
jgi:nucleoside-diphosphate-sugar epimerase